MTDKKLNAIEPDAAEINDGDRWPYPWDRDEDPDWIDPKTGIALRDLTDHGDGSYFRWFTAMREKYNSNEKPHQKRWFPRYRDFVDERKES